MAAGVYTDARDTILHQRHRLIFTPSHHTVMGPESGEVVVRDFDGNVLSSFWQYGLMDWDLFYTCLDAIIFANDSWAIFHYDEHAPGRKGALCPAGCKEYPNPGTYILLTPGIYQFLKFHTYIIDILQMAIRSLSVWWPLRLALVIHRHRTHKQG